MRDSGCGIPEDQLATLFTPMQQIDASDSRPKGGLGLGLAISRRIVELHGGRIGVEGAADGGSTFWFSVPADAEDDNANGST